MGPALHLIGRLYAVEERARDFTPGERLVLRQRLSAPVMEKLRGYLEKIRGDYTKLAARAREDLRRGLRDTGAPEVG